jgi:GT2 family glycosyltransferase
VTPPSCALSILIVSWNARDLLARCLRSLTPCPHELIVLDNASADGSADMVARDFPAVRLVRHARNAGFAGGVNLARRHASGERLLLLNPDIDATLDAIDELIAALNRDGRIAAVGGRLVNEDGTPQTGFNVRRFPTLATFAVDLLLLDHLWPDNPVSRRYFARDLPDDLAADVDQPAAACLMLRASVFDEVGGMDERFYPAWFEDVDLCRRIKGAGYRVRYEPRATFIHRGGVAMRTLGLGAFALAWYRNMTRYARKHHGLVGWLAVKALIVIGMVLRIAASVVRGHRTAARAYAAVLRDSLSRGDTPARPPGGA